MFENCYKLWPITILILVLGWAVIAYGHDPNGDPQVTAWMMQQKQEESPVPCCGIEAKNGGDAHETKAKVVAGQWWVTVDGNWVIYPNPVNPYHQNPTGKNWVWYLKVGGDRGIVFYCLRLATGV